MKYYSSAFSDEEFEIDSEPEEEEESQSEEEATLSESVSTLGSLEDYMEGAGALSLPSSPAMTEHTISTDSNHSLSLDSHSAEALPGAAGFVTAEANIASSPDSRTSVSEPAVPNVPVQPTLAQEIPPVMMPDSPELEKPSKESSMKEAELSATATGDQQKEGLPANTPNVTKDHFYFYQGEQYQQLLLGPFSAQKLMCTCMGSGVTVCHVKLLFFLLLLLNFFPETKISMRGFDL